MGVDAVEALTVVAVVASDAEVPVKVPSRGLERGIITSSVLRSGFNKRI